MADGSGTHESSVRYILLACSANFFRGKPAPISSIVTPTLILFSGTECSGVMSLLETEDYFEIPEEPDRTSGQVRPLWSSAGAHLDPPNQEQVQFLVTNSGFTQAYPKSKITSEVLKAMERDADEATRASDAQGAKSDSYSRYMWIWNLTCCKTCCYDLSSVVTEISAWREKSIFENI